LGASDRHLQAALLIERGEEDQAYAVVQDILRTEGDDPEALWLLGNLHAKAEQYMSALLAFKHAATLKPDHHQVLNNVGMALEGMGKSAEAREWFLRAHKRNPAYPPYLCNIGMTHLQQGDVKSAELWSNKALALDAEHAEAHTCRGFALLAQGRFAEGWDDYRYALGGKFRAVQDYGLPEWNGERGARVVVCTEQGVGDEIMYASILPDLVERVESVTLDCDARLVKLLRRSFGDRIAVHGTRKGEKPWFNPERHTHQLMIGELPRHFRRSIADFPGTPYLKVNEDHATMYEALLAHHAGGKRRIGLMMSGGGLHTGRKRALGVESFRSLVQQHSDTCEFFSLEYKPNSGEEIARSGLPIRHFHWAVGQGADFDHTAAFISRLDMVVGVHTTAMHAAGALGVPTVALVPAQPSWQYGLGLGESFPWYRSVRLFRQKPSESWMQCVKRLAAEFRP